MGPEMTAKHHTPGPWFVSRDPRPDMEWNLHIASVDDPNHEICSMFHDGKPGNELGEANAAIVAAGPTMLDALERVEWWLSTVPQGAAMRDVCRAAIKEARGE